MAAVNVYLVFNGKCEEAFTFYKSVFGGEFPYVGRFGDMPPGEDGKSMSSEDAKKIMHISLPVGQGTILMGSDTAGEMAKGYKEGNNFSISVAADSREEADKLFNGLAAGGQVTMPMNDTFWGAYFGMFTDKFNINWMVNYDDPAKMPQQ